LKSFTTWNSSVIYFQFAVSIFKSRCFCFQVTFIVDKFPLAYHGPGLNLLWVFHLCDAYQFFVRNVQIPYALLFLKAVKKMLNSC